MAAKGKSFSKKVRRRRGGAESSRKKAEGNGALAEGNPARVDPPLELLVKAWAGAVDGDQVNDAMLLLMRRHAEKSPLSEAERARRSGLKRQQCHNILTDVKVLPVPALVNWWKSEQKCAAFMLWRVIKFCQERAADGEAENAPK